MFMIYIEVHNSILRDFDPEGAVAVLTTLRDFLETNSTFKVQHKSIGIIPGYEEGTSGWIAVNYLVGSLKQVYFLLSFFLLENIIFRL